MDELRYTLALTAVKGLGSAKARLIIETFGSARAIFEADKATLLSIPKVGEALVKAVSDTKIFERVDQEIRFIEDHNVMAACYGDTNYPHRLLECHDAPSVLFTLGQPITESKHVISIVGTRQCTQYGRDATSRFVAELHELIPDLVVVSGLAFGIDITAHRAALENHVPTIAVVAHGLDSLYPYQHRDEARRIIAEGGAIITEYQSGVTIDRPHLLARNRIVAGLSDAVLVAESKSRGGSLVTASIALDYERDVFAFPGRIGDSRSEGCNRLIRLNRAGLVTSAQDFVEAMRWDTDPSQRKAIQHTLNFEEDNMSSEERAILDALRDVGDMRISQLSEVTKMEHSQLQELLLDLEMDGRIRSCPGGVFQLR